MSETCSGSVKIDIGFSAETSIPHAKDFGRLFSRHFSMILLKTTEDGFRLQAWVRTTDVRSHDVEERLWEIHDTKELHNALVQLKKIDPTHRRITPTPLPSSHTEDVVRWMDVLGSAPDGSVLFPEIVIEPAQ